MSGRCQLLRAHVCENKTALLSDIKNGVTSEGRRIQVVVATS